MRIKITAASVAALLTGLSILGLANPVQPAKRASQSTASSSSPVQVEDPPSYSYGDDDDGYESE